MKSLKLSATLLFSLLIFLSCEKDPEENSPKAQLRFKTEMSTKSGSQRVFIGDTIEIGPYEFNLKKFKLYVSNINLNKSDGTSVLLKDILLADVGDNETGEFLADIEEGNYNSVTLSFGLDSIQNNSVPENFAREHPLSSFNQMYWTMLKYRFAIFEGRSNKIDSLGTATDRLNAYHPGTDVLYRSRTFPLDINVTTQSTRTIILNLKLDELFYGNDTIDLRTEPQTHSEPVDFHVATKFMDNLKDCAEISLL